MNRTFTLIIGSIFFIGLIGFAWFFTPNEAAAPEPANEPTAYENATQGYALSYPSDLAILEYAPDMATIGRPLGGGIDGVVDVRTVTIEGLPGETPAMAAARELANLCAADGPGSSFSCTGVDRVGPFRTEDGLTGFRVYLKGELREFATETVTAVEKGPYIGFVLETGAAATKALIIHAPLNQSAEEADTATIEAVARSVRIGS